MLAIPISSIARRLGTLFAGEGTRAAIRESLRQKCESFLASGLADPKFKIELTSGSDAKFWACISEALIYERLRGKHFPARFNAGSGPDFLLEFDSKHIWIEVICPEPAGVPADWLKFQANSNKSVPHEEILLRWTSAIKAKHDRLLGYADAKGYMESGIVLPQDIYVIAVNGCQMRNGPFPFLHGISQLPFAAEAVFPIGPRQIVIDRDTLKPLESGHQHRWEIKKPNGSLVSTHLFLDTKSRMVSAIWAVDFAGLEPTNIADESALIHNPNAANPLPRGFLAVDEEYEAMPDGVNNFFLRRIR